MKKIVYSFLLISLFSVSVFFITLPDVSILKKQNPTKTSFMEYRENEWKSLGQKRTVHQEWIAFSKVSPFLIKALVISEDAKFWQHEGFDYEAIEKAIEKDIKLKKFKKGGSTLTQQLAKNLYLSPEKLLFRKIREAAITWKLEKNLSKRRILEIYLNVVEWGDGIYGVEAASHQFFGKSASELTAMEASRLVCILPNPRKYRPDGTQKYVINRSLMIYRIMVERGIVDSDFEQLGLEKENIPGGESMQNNSPGPVPESLSNH